MAKTKIALDADVIIHFYKGEQLTLLPTILNEYDHIILSKVYEELNRAEKTCVDKMESLLRTITIVDYLPSGEELREFALLNRTRGKGESACMAYCKFHNDVIGSSNLKDIRTYCTDNGIVYLTTFDFLYFAIKRGKMSIAEAKQFIQKVREKESILPDYDIETYVSQALI